MITSIQGLTVRVVQLSYGDIDERRMELVQAATDDPLMSLPITEAAVLAGQIIRGIGGTRRAAGLSRGAQSDDGPAPGTTRRG